MLSQSVKFLALLTSAWTVADLAWASAGTAALPGTQISLVDPSASMNRNRAPGLGEKATPLPLPRNIPSVPTDLPISAPLPKLAAPDIQRDLSQLPEPVRLMHDRILEAARSGNIERLRPLLGTRYNATELSSDDDDTDPVEFLRALAGDKEGREILAILVDLLNSGYVHLNVGKDDEAYVWPYFYAISLDTLTPPQIVELLQLVTAGDYEDMKKAGGYIFYSIGLAPDGSWRFFTAGE